MRVALLFALGLSLLATSPVWAAADAPAQKPAAPILVSVHGAWAGGWQLSRVAPHLEGWGWKVYRPSLPGLGEHHHLASPAIGLEDHIQDIVNLILFENLHDVILLGHSYGGMVVTGVADRIPERIGRIIYLDAFLPEDGESVMTLRRAGGGALERMTRDGFVIPTWVAPDKPFPKDVPHPLKTFTDPIILKNQAAARRIPALYILTVEEGKPAEADDFYAFAERARVRRWPVMVMAADHNPHWRKPAETAALIESIVRLDQFAPLAKPAP